MEYLSLPQVAKIIMGQSPPSSTYNNVGDGLPFFQGKREFGELYPEASIFCNQPKKVAEPGDILLSVRAPVGPTNITKTRACIGRGLAAIRCYEDRAYRMYLLYYLRYLEPKIASDGKGSTFNAIGKNDLENILVPSVPLAEQKRIAAILEKADRLRRLRHYSKQTIGLMIRSIFTKIRIHADRSEPLNKVCKIERFNSSEEERQKLPYVSLEHIESGTGFFVESYRQLIEERVATQYKFSNHHVLYGKLRPYLNKATIPDFYGVCSTEILPLHPLPGLLDKYYLWQFLLSEEFVNWSSSNMTGANLPRVSPHKISSHEIPLPSIELQIQFNQMAKIYIRIFNLQQEYLRQTDHLFQSLLNRAFRGSCRIII